MPVTRPHRTFLGLGTLALLLDPEQLTIVRDDPEAVGPADEELMRYLSIVHSGIPWFAWRDTELGGVAIPGGSVVVDPAVVDLGRAAEGQDRSS